MHVLHIEDDESMVNVVRALFLRESASCEHADLGADGVAMSNQRHYDIIILDLDLRDMHGFDVIQKIRSERIHTPIIVLSANIDVDTKVRSFKLGADEYITKPFHHDELIARTRAIFRRYTAKNIDILKIGRMAINLKSKTVQVEGRDLHLTGKEYSLLEILSLKKGTIVTKEAIVRHIYRGMEQADSGTIGVFICNIRRKIKMLSGEDTYIVTLRDKGFLLQEPAAQKKRVAALHMTEPSAPTSATRTSESPPCR